LWPQGQWSVKITNPEQTFKCLNTPLKIEFNGIDNGYPKGHTNIFLSAAQGSGMNRITVICDFKVMASVWIVTSTIQRGQPVKVEDCELKMVDITRFAPHPFTSLKDFHNVCAARMITPGMILHDRLVQAIPVVAKGEFVDILLQKGKVRVAVQGVARESGSTGELIWVENAVSHKLIRVTIKEKGVVLAPQGGNSI
jgi:flagella basal body P-ring formation protein FlgA